MSVTSKRLPNGYHAIFHGDKRVGEVWRYPKPHQGRAFGMRLDGYCWLHGEARPHGRGGFSTVAVPLLRDALSLAERTLASGVMGTFDDQGDKT
jgi:hypothetical protein